MSRGILVDTGPVVAIIARADQGHSMCLEQLQRATVPLLTCWPVITEAAWLLQEYPGGLQELMTSASGRPFNLLTLDKTDLPAIAAILAKYKDLGVQLADAALMHLAEREGIDTIFTLDRRDFGVMRLSRGRKLRLIP